MPSSGAAAAAALGSTPCAGGDCANWTSASSFGAAAAAALRSLVAKIDVVVEVFEVVALPLDHDARM